MPDGLSGLSVITPAALWALLTLCIPFLIHLFSRSRGRLVRIGHIDLVRQARRVRVTEVKLTQLLLLLLRLGIFVLAALILAGLATTGVSSSKAPTTYVTPSWLQTSSEEDIDMLMEHAEQVPESRVYLLQAGFPQADRGKLESLRQQNLVGPEEFSDVWALLSERLSREQHRGKVMVYATDYMLQFGARKPSLPRDVEWHVSHSPQTPGTDGRATRVLILHDAERKADAELISSVLTTLKKHRLPELIWDIKNSGHPDAATHDIDWVIHLGVEQLSTDQIEEFNYPAVILADAGRLAPESTSQFVNLPFYPFTTFRLDRFTRVNPEEGNERTAANDNVLLDGPDGSPLLQQFQYGKSRFLQFNSRFNTNWNSLTQQAEFPELLLQLLTGNTQAALRFSDARVDTTNLASSRDSSLSDIPLPRRSLQGLLAMLLVLLWVSERWLSERNSRENR